MKRYFIFLLVTSVCIRCFALLFDWYTPSPTFSRKDPIPLRAFNASELIGESSTQVSTTNATKNLAKSNVTFLYLTQTEQCLPKGLLQPGMFGDPRLCSCNVFVLSFKSPCMTANNNSHVQYTFEKTTWTQGRNRLFKLSKRIRYPNLLYYIFLDDDVGLKFNRRAPDVLRGRPPSRAFEEWLLRQQPAIGVTDYNNRQNILEESWRKCCHPMGVKLPLEHMNTVYFDACFNAIHRNAIDYLLPYEETFDEYSWWNSQVYLHVATLIQFRGQVMLYKYVTTTNSLHRSYPRSSKNRAEITNYFIEEQVKKLPHQYREDKFILDLLANPATIENLESFCRMNVSAKQTIIPYQHFTWNITV